MRRVVGAHAVVDDHAAVDPQPRVLGQVDVGLDARGDEQDLGLEPAPVAQVDGAQAAVGVDEVDLGVEHDLEAEPLEVVAQQLAGARVELAARAGRSERSSTSVLSPSLCSA